MGFLIAAVPVRRALNRAGNQWEAVRACVLQGQAWNSLSCRGERALRLPQLPLPPAILFLYSSYDGALLRQILFGFSQIPAPWLPRSISFKPSTDRWDGRLLHVWDTLWSTAQHCTCVEALREKGRRTRASRFDNLATVLTRPGRDDAWRSFTPYPNRLICPGERWSKPPQEPAWDLQSLVRRPECAFDIAPNSRGEPPALWPASFTVHPVVKVKSLAPDRARASPREADVCDVCRCPGSLWIALFAQTHSLGTLRQSNW